MDVFVEQGNSDADQGRITLLPLQDLVCPRIQLRKVLFAIMSEMAWFQQLSQSAVVLALAKGADCMVLSDPEARKIFSESRWLQFSPI